MPPVSKSLTTDNSAAERVPYRRRIGLEGGPALNTDVRELERQAEARAHLLETSLTLVLLGPIGIGLALLLFSGLSLTMAPGHLRRPDAASPRTLHNADRKPPR